MWEGTPDHPSFKIPKSLHKKRNPVITINSSYKGILFNINGNKEVQILRNLPIYKGTFFAVEVVIE